MTFDSFRKKILTWYRTHGRHDLPWRTSRDPYAVMVSEIMLQQTQVDRVIEKYQAFMKRFPTVQSLARAKPASVIKLWQGLGYNRRALNLQRAAQTIVRDHGGVVPTSAESLESLPGIGPYTARAIAAFAFDLPVVFIETNIRRVFIHHFFADKKKVRDEQLIPLIKQALYTKSPHTWYSALMDYGALEFKKTLNPNRKSKHYARQSRFEGSNRQVRGMILRLVTENKSITQALLLKQVGRPAQVVSQNIDTLVAEGFLKQRQGKVSLA